MGVWSTLLKYSGKAAKGVGTATAATGKSMGKAVLHPSQTLRGAGQAVKTATIGGAVGYVGWEKLTTDKSVVRIVSDAVVGESVTNTTYLSNAVNNYFGCNFKRLINSYRVARAKELLDGKDCPVSELFSRCGFASKSVFYVAFRKVVGMTPLQYISQSRSPFMIQRN